MLGVDVEVGVAHVGEDRGRARVDDHVRGRGPRDRARDHLVARLDADGEEREMERGGAGGDGEHVLGLDELGEAPLELGRLRPGGQPAGAQRLRDRGDLLLADRRRLEAEHRLASGRTGVHGPKRNDALLTESFIASLRRRLQSGRTICSCARSFSALLLGVCLSVMAGKCERTSDLFGSVDDQRSRAPWKARSSIEAQRLRLSPHLRALARPSASRIRPSSPATTVHAFGAWIADVRSSTDRADRPGSKPDYGDRMGSGRPARSRSSGACNLARPRLDGTGFRRIGDAGRYERPRGHADGSMLAMIRRR